MYFGHISVIAFANNLDDNLLFVFILILKLKTKCACLPFMAYCRLIISSIFLTVFQPFNVVYGGLLQCLFLFYKATATLIHFLSVHYSDPLSPHI